MYGSVRSCCGLEGRNSLYSTTTCIQICECHVDVDIAFAVPGKRTNNAPIGLDSVEPVIPGGKMA